MGDLAAIRRYKRALAIYERAGEARSAAFEALFKPGDHIVHDRGGHLTRATVVRVCSVPWAGDWLSIRSESGKEYRIGAYHVLCLNGAEVRHGR